MQLRPVFGKARRYELPRSTISTILKNKEKFKHLFATSKLKPGIKRCRLATYQDVEEALFSWFKQARCMNVPISGPIMKIKAKELALKIFSVAQDGWKDLSRGIA